MKAIVKKHPETNEIVTVKASAKGNKFGQIRVDQTCAVTNNGFLSFKTRSAFIAIGEKDIDAARETLKDGMECPFQGKIVLNETREPQYEGHEPKINPETKEVFLLDGAPVYRTTEWTEDLSKEDTLVSSSNAVEEAVNESSVEEI